ncbi:hypothetical protein M427DRAFT_74762 [Gonapodya prolifera JEL478]|uniref:Uncharacterized protein n=1 Tax=Gonapodya prolifera (strain JEL478) TaxID=1344416 RepID=A0A139A0A9_GONPJ|nr:hypothetical protein M427DRAFT_74762 [Gonapodya prolifera JEL478]|eukprot:KXS09975.1 hypothetical protein M427DRAFT_74762 [Gonapodya prolifera JEL478]
MAQVKEDLAETDDHNQTVEIQPDAADSQLTLQDPEGETSAEHQQPSHTIKDDLPAHDEHITTDAVLSSTVAPEGMEQQASPDAEGEDVKTVDKQQDDTSVSEVIAPVEEPATHAISSGVEEEIVEGAGNPSMSDEPEAQGATESNLRIPTLTIEDADAENTEPIAQIGDEQAAEINIDQHASGRSVTEEETGDDSPEAIQHPSPELSKEGNDTHDEATPTNPDELSPPAPEALTDLPENSSGEEKESSQPEPADNTVEQDGIAELDDGTKALDIDNEAVASLEHSGEDLDDVAVIKNVDNAADAPDSNGVVPLGHSEEDLAAEENIPGERGIEFDNDEIPDEQAALEDKIAELDLEDENEEDDLDEGLEVESLESFDEDAATPAPNAPAWRVDPLHDSPETWFLDEVREQEQRGQLLDHLRELRELSEVVRRTKEREDRLSELEELLLDKTLQTGQLVEEVAGLGSQLANYKVLLRDAERKAEEAVEREVAMQKKVSRLEEDMEAAESRATALRESEVAKHTARITSLEADVRDLERRASREEEDRKVAEQKNETLSKQLDEERKRREGLVRRLNVLGTQLDSNVPTSGGAPPPTNFDHPRVVPLRRVPRQSAPNASQAADVPGDSAPTRSIPRRSEPPKVEAKPASPAPKMARRRMDPEVPALREELERTQSLHLDEVAKVTDLTSQLEVLMHEAEDLKEKLLEMQADHIREMESLQSLHKLDLEAVLEVRDSLRDALTLEFNRRHADEIDVMRQQHSEEVARLSEELANLQQELDEVNARIVNESKDAAAKYAELENRSLQDRLRYEVAIRKAEEESANLRSELAVLGERLRRDREEAEAKAPARDNLSAQERAQYEYIIRKAEAETSDLRSQLSLLAERIRTGSEDATAWSIPHVAASLRSDVQVPYLKTPAGDVASLQAEVVRLSALLETNQLQTTTRDADLKARDLQNGILQGRSGSSEEDAQALRSEIAALAERLRAGEEPNSQDLLTERMRMGDSEARSLLTSDLPPEMVVAAISEKDNKITRLQLELATLAAEKDSKIARLENQLGAVVAEADAKVSQIRNDRELKVSELDKKLQMLLTEMDGVQHSHQQHVHKLQENITKLIKQIEDLEAASSAQFETTAREKAHLENRLHEDADKYRELQSFAAKSRLQLETRIVHLEAELSRLSQFSEDSALAVHVETALLDSQLRATSDTLSDLSTSLSTLFEQICTVYEEGGNAAGAGRYRGVPSEQTATLLLAPVQAALLDSQLDATSDMLAGVMGSLQALLGNISATGGVVSQDYDIGVESPIVPDAASVMAPVHTALLDSQLAMTAKMLEDAAAKLEVVFESVISERTDSRTDTDGQRAVPAVSAHHPLAVMAPVETALLDTQLDATSSMLEDVSETLQGLFSRIATLHKELQNREAAPNHSGTEIALTSPVETALIDSQLEATSELLSEVVASFRALVEARQSNSTPVQPQHLDVELNREQTPIMFSIPVDTALLDSQLESTSEMLDEFSRTLHTYVENVATIRAAEAAMIADAAREMAATQLDEQHILEQQDAMLSATIETALLDSQLEATGDMLTAALTGVHGVFTQLLAERDNLARDVSSMSGLLESVQSQLAASENRTAQLVNQISQLELQQGGALPADTDRAEVDDLRSMLSVAETRSVDLEATHRRVVDQQVAEHDARVQAIEMELSRVQARVVELELLLDSKHNDQTGSENKELENAIIRVQELESEIEHQKLSQSKILADMTEAHTTQLAGLEAELAGVRSQLAESKSVLTSTRDLPSSASHTGSVASNSSVSELQVEHERALDQIEEDHRGQVRSLEAKINQLVLQLEHQGEEHSRLREERDQEYADKISTLESDLAAARDKIVDLEAESKKTEVSPPADFESKFDELQNQLSDAKSDLAEVEGQLRAKLEEQANIHGETVRVTQSTEDELKNRISELEQRLQDLDSKYRALLEGKADDVEPSETQTKELTDDLTSHMKVLEEQLNLSLQRESDLNAELSTSKEILGTNNAEIPMLQQQLSEAQSKIVELENKLIAVSADQSEEAARLNEVLSALRTEHKTLEESSEKAIADLRAKIMILRAEGQQRDEEAISEKSQVERLNIELLKCQNTIASLLPSIPKSEEDVSSDMPPSYDSTRSIERSSVQNETIQQLTKQLSEKEAELETLRKEHELEREQSEAKLATVKNQRAADAKKVKTAITSLQQQIEKYKAQLEETARDAESRVADVKALMETKISELTVERDRDSQLAAEKIINLQIQLQEEEARLLQLQNQLKAAQTELSKATARAVGLEYEIRDLERENTREKETFKTIVADLSQHLENAVARESELKNTASDLEQRLNASETTIAPIRQQLELAEVSLSDLRLQLENAAAREDKVTQITHELEREIRVAEGVADELREQLEQAHLRDQAASRTIQELTSKLNDGTDMVESSVESASEADTIIAQLRSQLTLASAKEEQLTKATQDLQERLKAAQESLSEVRRATSARSDDHSADGNVEKNINAELATREAAAKDADLEIERLTSELARVSDLYQEARSEIERLAPLQKDLILERSAPPAEEVNASDDQATQLAQRVFLLEKDVLSKADEYSKVVSEHAQHINSISAQHKVELDGLRQQLAIRENEVHLAKTNLAKLQEQVDDMEERLRSQSQIATAHDEARALVKARDEKISQLREELEVRQANMNQLLQKYADLEEEYKEYVQDKKQETSSFNSQLAALSEFIEERDARIADLVAEKDDAKKNLEEEQRSGLARLQEMQNQHNTKIGVLQARIDGQDGEYQSLMTEVARDMDEKEKEKNLLREKLDALEKRSEVESKSLQEQLFNLDSKIAMSSDLVQNILPSVKALLGGGDVSIEELEEAAFTGSVPDNTRDASKGPTGAEVQRLSHAIEKLKKDHELEISALKEDHRRELQRVSHETAIQAADAELETIRNSEVPPPPYTTDPNASSAELLQQLEQARQQLQDVQRTHTQKLSHMRTVLEQTNHLFPENNQLRQTITLQARELDDLEEQLRELEDTRAELEEQNQELADRVAELESGEGIIDQELHDSRIAEYEEEIKNLRIDAQELEEEYQKRLAKVQMMTNIAHTSVTLMEDHLSRIEDRLKSQEQRHAQEVLEYTERLRILEANHEERLLALEADYEAKLEALEGEITSLQEALASEGDKNAERAQSLIDEVRSGTAMVHDYEYRLGLLEVEGVKLVNGVKKAHEETSGLEAEVASYDDDVRTLVEEAEKLGKAAEVWKRTTENLRTENEKLRQQLNQFESKSVSAAVSAEAVSNDVAASSGSPRTVYNEPSEVENLKLNGDTKDLQAELERSLAQVAELQNAQSSAAAEVTSLTVQLATVTNTITTLRSEKEQLQSDLTLLRTEHNEEHDSLMAKVSSLETQIGSLSAEKTSLENQLKEQGLKSALLQQQTPKLKQTIKELRAEVSAQKERISELQARVGEA